MYLFQMKLHYIPSFQAPNLNGSTLEWFATTEATLNLVAHTCGISLYQALFVKTLRLQDKIILLSSQHICSNSHPDDILSTSLITILNYLKVGLAYPSPRWNWSWYISSWNQTLYKWECPSFQEYHMRIKDTSKWFPCSFHWVKKDYPRDLLWWSSKSIGRNLSATQEIVVSCSGEPQERIKTDGKEP